MSPTERDNIILEAALEWGPDCYYDISPGTMGETLYVTARYKDEASRIRKIIPGTWHGLYTVVLYPTHIKTEKDYHDENPDLYDPKLT